MLLSGKVGKSDFQLSVELGCKNTSAAEEYQQSLQGGLSMLGGFAPMALGEAPTAPLNPLEEEPMDSEPVPEEQA